MENLEGDAELLQEIVEIFLDMGPEQLDSITNCIAAGDVNAVQTQARGMKGGASNIGAVKFVQTALSLEMLAKEGTLDGASELLSGMRDDFEDLKQAMAVVDWQEVTDAYTGV